MASRLKERYEKEVTSLLFVNNLELVSASKDKTIRVWNLQSLPR